MLFIYIPLTFFNYFSIFFFLIFSTIFFFNIFISLLSTFFISLSPIILSFSKLFTFINKTLYVFFDEIKKILNN